MANNPQQAAAPPPFHHGSLRPEDYERLMREQAQRRRHDMTISEAERLAKAGVSIDLDRINLKPDVQPNWYEEYRELNRMLTAKIQLAYPYKGASSRKFSYVHARPVGWRVEGGECETVAVFIVTNRGTNVMLEDELRLFPSDALMGKIALLLETEK